MVAGLIVRRLVIRAGRIARCFMILASSITMLVLGRRIQLAIAADLWRLAIKCSCSIAGWTTVVLNR